MTTERRTARHRVAASARRRVAAGLVLAVAAVGPTLSAPIAAQERPILTEKDVGIELPDGVRLSADIYRPDADGRFPVIVARTPYGNDPDPNGPFFAGHGYAYVTVDVRGRYDSEGEFYPYRNEAEDGRAVIAWAAGRPWSNGDVGTMGGSYLGFSQWLAAAARPPALRTMIVSVSPVDYYDSPVHTGGAFNLGGRLPWAFLVDSTRNQPMEGQPWDRALRHLPLATADSLLDRRLEAYRDWVAHPTKDAYWERYAVGDRWDDIDIPVFHQGGWFDEFLRGTLAGYAGMTGGSGTSARQQRLLIGPWTHLLSSTRQVGAVDFGEGSVLNLAALALEWFDRHLKGEPDSRGPAEHVEVFVMGTNEWRTFRSWPPEGRFETRFYLRSDGRANTRDGDGRLTQERPREREDPDAFRYDPADPVPTVGGATCCVAPGLYPEIMPWGPQDRRAVETRDDVLVYTSEPMDANLTVIGPVTVRLWASSSAPDTDFTVTLVDVAPDGTAIGLADGIVRARYRESVAAPSLLEPGRAYAFDIDLAGTANTFRRGHRIRIEVSSSNFPWYDRNLNTGGDLALETRMQAADQRVYHEPGRLSYVTLHVVTSHSDVP